MATEVFSVGQVVWARFGAKLYPGVVEHSEDPDAVGKVCVRYFPDLKNCSFVKPTLVWDYLLNRDRYAVDRTFKANSNWRKLLIAADKYLGIVAEIPEPRASTRNSSSGQPSETASVGTNDHIVNPQSASAKSDQTEKFDKTNSPMATAEVMKSHSPRAVDAIEMPDEEVQPVATVDEYAFVDEAANEPAKTSRTSPRRVNKQPVVEQQPKSSGKKKQQQQQSPIVINGDSHPTEADASGQKLSSESGKKPVDSVGKRGRGRPASGAAGESPSKRSRVSNGVKEGKSDNDVLTEPKKRGRPSLNSPREKKQPEKREKASSQPSLPPVCASSGGNAAFDEAYSSVQRKISSTDLNEMPRIVHPGKTYDSKPPRTADFLQENSLRYGFIGLQSLSLIIVRHLCSSKAEVHVFDSNPQVMKQAVCFGAIPCLSRTEVVDLSDVIFTSLLTEREAHEAFFTPGEGIIACVDPSKGIVDLGTPNVAYVQQINEMLTDRRVAYLYCATFGSVVDAADCKLSFCVAGSSRLYKDIADLLRSLGGAYETSGHWQDPTMALKAKAISDMLVIAENFAFCEALGMAQKCGLPTDFMLKVMRHQSKDHFSHCLPPEASQIGSTSEIGKSSTKDAPLPLPLSLSATAAMSPNRNRSTYDVEALRSLTSPVSYSAAFAQCFSSLANEHGMNTQSLFVAMHAIISAKSSSPVSTNEDISALLQRLSSLI